MFDGVDRVRGTVPDYLEYGVSEVAVACLFFNESVTANCEKADSLYRSMVEHGQ